MTRKSYKYPCLSIQRKAINSSCTACFKWVTRTRSILWRHWLLARVKSKWQAQQCLDSQSVQTLYRVAQLVRQSLSMTTLRHSGTVVKTSKTITWSRVKTPRGRSSWWVQILKVLRSAKLYRSQLLTFHPCTRFSMCKSTRTTSLSLCWLNQFTHKDKDPAISTYSTSHSLGNSTLEDQVSVAGSFLSSILHVSNLRLIPSPLRSDFSYLRICKASSSSLYVSGLSEVKSSNSASSITSCQVDS